MNRCWPRSRMTSGISPASSAPTRRTIGRTGTTTRQARPVLEPFVPPLITVGVRLHVAARRFLCATDLSYFSRLSPASVHTLSLQGGPMRDEEIAHFRAEPFHLKTPKS
jgi:predicted HD phosphohydrolase